MCYYWRMYNTRHTSIVGQNLADILGHVLVAASDRFGPFVGILSTRVSYEMAESGGSRRSVRGSPCRRSFHRSRQFRASRVLSSSGAPHPCSICVPFLPWNCSVRVPMMFRLRSTNHRLPATKWNKTEQNGTRKRENAFTGTKNLSRRLPWTAQTPDSGPVYSLSTVMLPAGDGSATSPWIHGSTISSFSAPTYRCLTTPSFPMNIVTGSPTTP